tara:strand:+ start:6622 stop:6819 length:198 start_codon:yes stop_codon:yes gene_type:complete
MTTETRELQKIWKTVQVGAKKALQGIRIDTEMKMKDKARVDTLLEVVTDSKNMLRELRGGNSART